MDLKERMAHLYSANYKRYMVIPAILFIILPLIVFVFPGMRLGIDVSGGTLIIVRTQSEILVNELYDALAEFELSELNIVPFSDGVQISFGPKDEIEEARALMSEARQLAETNPDQSLSLCRQAYAKIEPFGDFPPPDNAKECAEQGFVAIDEANSNISKNIDNAIINTLALSPEDRQRIQHTEVSPALGALFWRYALQVLLIAAVAIAIVIFLFFREVIPTLAILLSASFDILTALAGLALFGMPFSLITVSAILMLVGYSVDTDIMLSTRLFKGTGKLDEDASSALNTGLTMTGTTLVAMGIMSVLSLAWGLEALSALSIVLFFGLLGDLVSTWFMNAPMLLWYAERKKSRGRK